MKKQQSILLLLGLTMLLVLASCASFPRSTVSTQGQDITIAMYDTSTNFDPSVLGTLTLNHTIHLLDTNATKTEIKDPDALFATLKENFTNLGYTVDSVQYTSDELDTMDLTGITLINVSESQEEFTMHYYYNYWGGWYYPPYYGGWYSYTYTIGSVIVGMLNGDTKKEIWTGVISGFTDRTVPQTQRIANGINEFFILPPFQVLN